MAQALEGARATPHPQRAPRAIGEPSGMPRESARAPEARNVPQRAAPTSRESYGGGAPAPRSEPSGGGSYRGGGGGDRSGGDRSGGGGYRSGGGQQHQPTRGGEGRSASR
jgi:hypothetical protein